MKKSFVLSALILISFRVFSQNDTIWRTGGLSALNFKQVSLTNWAAGGDNSIGGNALLNLYANMKKNNWAWDNSLDLAIGGSKVGKQEFRKTDDKIDLNSKVGYDMGKNLYVTYLLGFRTQFTEGFKYDDNNNRTRISNFLTPGYMLNSLGTDWKPMTDLSIFISPITAKTTLVNDQLLIDLSELTNVALYGVDPGKKVRNEMGAYFVGKYKSTLMENVVFSTRLELFSCYNNNPQNLDINWENIISFKINKYINALIMTQLLYDNDVFVPKNDVNAPAGPGTQFKESFGIGFSYKFDGVKVKQ